MWRRGVFTTEDSYKFKKACTKADMKMFARLTKGKKIPPRELEKVCLSGSIVFVREVMLEFPFEFTIESLVYAASAGSLDLVNLILEGGVKDDERRALFAAAESRRLALADQLIQLNPLSESEKGKFLEDACQGDWVNVVAYQDSRRLMPKNLDSSIQLAISSDSANILSILKNRGNIEYVFPEDIGSKVDIIITNNRVKFDKTIMVRAIQDGLLKVLALMLSLVPPDYNSYPAFLCCIDTYGKDKAFELMLEHGMWPCQDLTYHEANGKLFAGCHRILFDALRYRRPKIVELYLDKIKPPSGQCKTYLEIAELFKFDEVVRCLAKAAGVSSSDPDLRK